MGKRSLQPVKEVPRKRRHIESNDVSVKYYENFIIYNCRGILFVGGAKLSIAMDFQAIQVEFAVNNSLSRKIS